MKIAIFFLFSLFCFPSFAQVLNGSFETDSVADLSHWKWTCGAEPQKSTAPGGGNWCIKVSGGNYQGCFPGYAYQILPSITNGQTYVLSGWALTQTSPMAGIYFGSIHNGIISLLEGSSTTAATWTHLTVKSDLNLRAGDTAVVVLSGGITGGPAQGYGYFDLISLQQLTGIGSAGLKHSITISPNPFSTETVLHSDRYLRNATLTVLNSSGQTILKSIGISGQTITINRNHLPCGIYILKLTQDHAVISINKLIIAGN